MSNFIKWQYSVKITRFGKIMDVKKSKITSPWADYLSNHHDAIS
jgi:hypothetical protein